MFPFRAFRFLAPLVREQRPIFLVGIVLILLTSLSQVAVPRLVGLAIQKLETGVGVHLITPIAFAMVGAVLIRGLTSFWTRETVIASSRRIEKKLRDQLYEHISSLDGSFYSKTHTGDLMSRFTSDIEAVRMVFGPAVMYSVQTAFTLIFALSMMIQIDWKLTLYSLIPLGFLTVAIRVIGPKVHKESMRAQEMLSGISVHSQENFANAPVIKAFVVEDAEVERMQRLSHDYFRQNLRIAKLRAISGSAMWLFGDLALVTLLLVGGTRILSGELGLGDFATFNGCQLLLIWPMIALGWVMNLFHRGAASAERLQTILDASPLVDNAQARSDINISEGRVSFDKVSFRYLESERPALEDVSFNLKAGGTLGIVGTTASGKTSLLHLVPRLSPVSSGKILIDGNMLEQYPLGELRAAISMVPQEPFLFSATVAENISFGVDNATHEEIVAVARLVRMDQEIEKFPDGYNQRVGERGITLSGGQKQRLAIARAILQRPRILLLDDVLSAVDSETETAILAGLKDWTRDLTSLIVTHRLSAVTHADEIVVLEDGRIVERGTHQSLLEKKGRYNNLWKKQTIESELEDLE
ncbi:MAG: ATP-binding cassette domain-containing protein [Proteobacteria bacterium]|jgi:ATP-binding cassette, subfamily B, multidrug efflux pump|nr:ATP-binding cassette domain-containing protein [Planctomycetia bacterium]NCG57347.1 ATP-binding cassette domain-containing protein [Pseudomonadota bacterium]